MNVAGQNQAQNIIDAENARIDAKEQSYQNMQFGKKRVLELNANFQNRTTAFNWIVVIFFITLAFIIFLLYLDRIVPGIHDYITIATYVVLFIGIAYCIYLYAAFIRRDPSDYDKIIYSPDADAVTLSPNGAAANASIQGGGYASTTQTSTQIPRQLQTYYTNPQGKLINVYGQYVDSNGNILKPDGTPMGPPVLFQSEPIKLYKNAIGQIVDVNGHPIDPITGKPTTVSGVPLQIDSKGNVVYLNPVTGVPFDKLPTTITAGTPPKEITVNEDGTLMNVSGLNIQIDSKGNVVYLNPVTGLPFDKLPTTITTGTPPKEIIVNADGTLESPKGTFVNINGKPINPDGTVISMGTTASGSSSSSLNAYGTTASGSSLNAYGTTASGSSLNAYGTTASGNVNVYGTTISSSIGSYAYNTTTPLSVKMVDKLNGILSGNLDNSIRKPINVPTLITGEIYLGDLGRNTIYVEDAKTIIFYYLNTSKDIFTSLDGLNFTNTNNPNLIARVVTEGPKSSLNKKITGKGIKISIKDTNINHYFYPSTYPALLKKNDTFIGPNGDTQIQVITQNRFKLTKIYENNSNTNDLNVVSTYTSNDGVYFSDDKGCALNKAKIVLNGPKHNITNQDIYGQAIQLYDNDSGENIYFYYNGNTSDNGSNSNVNSQPETEFSAIDVINANSQVQTTPISIGTTPYNSIPPATTSMMPQNTPFPGTPFPGTPFPGTPFPGTPFPGTTLPGTTLPGTTLPGTILPGTTRPGTTLPGTTLPGTTLPGTTLPGTILPGTTRPGTTLPGTTLPGTTLPGTTLPGTTRPGTTLPGTTLPGTTRPGTTLPGTTRPGTTLPGTTLPGTTLPGTTLPATTPGIITSDKYTLFENTNSQFNDIGGPIENSTAIKCQSICDANPDCYGYIFDKRNYACWIKNNQTYPLSSKESLQDVDMYISNKLLSSTEKVPGLEWESYTTDKLEKIKTSDSGTLIKNIKYFDTTIDARFGTPRDFFKIFLKGYFKPNQTGTWSFVTGIPNVQRNDDLTMFWIGDDNSNHWPPIDNNFVLNPSHISGDYQYSTQLTSGKYYPIQIHFYQHTSTMLFNFYFKGPGTDWTTDGSEFFFSDKPSEKVPGLAWKSFNGPAVSTNDVRNGYPLDNNISVLPHLFFNNAPQGGNITKENLDWEDYISINSDLPIAGINTLDKAWEHYINDGKQEGRWARIKFNNNTKYHTFQNDPFFNSSNTKTSTVGTTVREIMYDNNIATGANQALFGFKNNHHNPGGDNISLIFKGYFKPDTTGPWKFLFGKSTGPPNDDISVFWMDDKNNVNGTTSHWPPSDTNWNFKTIYTSPVWHYETPSLTAGIYYPIQISWGQSFGGSIFAVQFSNGGPWRSNGDGYFFSDRGQMETAISFRIDTTPPPANLPAPTTTTTTTITRAPTTTTTTRAPIVFDRTLIDSSKTTCIFKVIPYDSNTTLIIITGGGDLYFKYKVNTCKFAAIGGGGGGGSHGNNNAGGGGGGGGVGSGGMNGTLLYHVFVERGNGGSANNNGSNTSVKFKGANGTDYGSVIAYGGGRGGTGKMYGENGGNGGGGGSGSNSAPRGGGSIATTYNGGYFGADKYTSSSSGGQGQRQSDDEGAGGGGGGCSGGGGEGAYNGGGGGGGIIYYRELLGGGGGGGGRGAGGGGGNGAGRGGDRSGNGADGTTYGAGGGGGGNYSGAGGRGANGAVILAILNSNFIIT